MLPNMSMNGSAAGTLVIALAILFLVFAAGGYLMNVRGRSNERASAAISAAQTHLQQTESASRAATARLEDVNKRREQVKAASKRAVAHAMALRRRVRPRQTELLVEVTPGSEVKPVPVPEVVLERVRADSSAIAALSLAVAWDDSVVTAQGHRIVADSIRHDAARATIAALERVQRKPRCGRKCGIALGALGVAVLGVVVDQARRIVGRG